MKYLVTCSAEKARRARESLGEAGFAIMQGASGGVGGGYWAAVDLELEAFKDGGAADCEPALGELARAGVIKAFRKG